MPRVAFIVDVIPEMIDHQSTGWLATPFDPADSVAEVEWVVHHQNHEPLRVSAKGKALTNHSLSVISGLHKKLYENLLAIERG